MTVRTSIEDLDLRAYIRPSDQIFIGQACGEPRALVGVLTQQSHDVGGLSIFIGSSFSGLLTPDKTENFRLSSMGAIGSLGLMAKAGALRIVPIHMSQIGPAIESGKLGCDVAMIQVSPADADGNHSCGLVSDHVRAAVQKARLVIAEVNAALPFTHGETVHASEIDLAVHVDHNPLEIASPPIGEVENAIARHCGAFIDDGAVLQTGVGTMPDAILGVLTDHKDLGIHSGMLGDRFVDLVEAGVVTNARKEIDTGISVTGALVGTRKLYDHADRNPSLRMAQIASILGLSSVAGRLCVGMLLDRMPAPFVALGALAIAAFGVLLLYLFGLQFAPFAVALVGLAAGAEVDLVAYLCSRQFGTKAYGTIYGWQYSVFVMGYGFSPFLVGLARDYFGNYDVALLASAGSVALAGILALLLRSKPEFESEPSTAGALSGA